MLKAIDPFFSKHGAGTFLPISISGTRDSPTLEFSIFHKKMRKTFGDNKDEPPSEGKAADNAKEPKKN